MTARFISTCVISISLAATAAAADLGDVPRYHVIDISFEGPVQGPRDTPERDIRLSVTLRHESGELAHTLTGFWDGDGRGGARGGVFRVRFCPTATGRWEIVETISSHAELNGQREGDVLDCAASEHPGFWIADGHWYRRSDGSHPYIVGNTHYSFLSRRNDRGPVETDPVADIAANARYFSKLRFSLMPDRYPDPELKPFLDDDGRPTDDGRYAHRPNPQWFHRRVDPVIAAGRDADLICDLILCGPDTLESRSTLRGEHAGAWLKYVAARYGSYPHVWICLANEWDIKEPQYSADEMRGFGETIREFLPYPTPVSAHAAPGDWKSELSGTWHDHVILQDKIKSLPSAADVAARNRQATGQPVINDENAYQGDGDGFSEADTVEGCFGTFLGGGYASTGEKYGEKLGQYFWGGFDADAHTAARGLGRLRDYVNSHIRFWKLEPLPLAETPFKSLGKNCRVLGRPDGEFVLGSNRAAESRVRLPHGEWRIVQVDLLGGTTRTLAEDASGDFALTLPESRAVLTHFVRRDE